MSASISPSAATCEFGELEGQGGDRLLAQAAVAFERAPFDAAHPRAGDRQRELAREEFVVGEAAALRCCWVEIGEDLRRMQLVQRVVPARPRLFVEPRRRPAIRADRARVSRACATARVSVRCGMPSVAGVDGLDRRCGAKASSVRMRSGCAICGRSLKCSTLPLT